jgi:hypothetical protein
VDQPTLGKSFFKVFKTESYITDSEYILIPKKTPKKPKPVRAPKPTPGKKPAEGDAAEGAEAPAPTDGAAPAEEKKK